MKEAGQIILHHHEFYDGSGYPQILKVAIPVLKDALAVVSRKSIFRIGLE